MEKELIKAPQTKRRHKLITHDYLMALAFAFHVVALATTDYIITAVNNGLQCEANQLMRVVQTNPAFHLVLQALISAALGVGYIEARKKFLQSKKNTYSSMLFNAAVIFMFALNFYDAANDLGFFLGIV